MRAKHHKPKDRVTLSERLFMAGAAPVFFKLALITVAIYALHRGPGFHGLKRLYFTTGPTAWLFIIVPAIVGFLGGIEGCARLLGHAFWTHHENERSITTTVVVWAVFLLAFGLGLGFLSAA